MQIYYNQGEFRVKSGVYIIEDKERGMYKIGCSKDTYKRSKDVIKACRFSGIKTDLQVFCIINCIRYRIMEKHIHLLLSKYKYQGEWYKCSEYELNVVLMELDLSYYNKK